MIFFARTQEHLGHFKLECPYLHTNTKRVNTMETNIHHPSHYFRRTAIAAIVASVLSPAVYAEIQVGTPPGTITLPPGNTAGQDITITSANPAISKVSVLDTGINITTTNNNISIRTTGANSSASLTAQGGQVVASDNNITVSGNSAFVGNNVGNGFGVDTNGTIVVNGINTKVIGNSQASVIAADGLSGRGNITVNTSAASITASSAFLNATTGGGLVANSTGMVIKGNQLTPQGLFLNNNGSIALNGTTNLTGTAKTAGLTIDSTGNTVSLLNNVNNSVGATSGHGLTIGATGTTLTGGTNSSIISALDGSATISVGTATTAPVTVINASNTNGNTSFALNAQGTTAANSILAAPITNPAGTSGNISSFTRDGVTVPQTTNQGGQLGTTISESASSVLLTNGHGITNGLQVFENRTNLAGDTINLMGNVTASNISANGTISAPNGNFTNLTAANGNITNLTAANGNITNLTSVNGNFTNIAAANGNITNLTAANGNITNLTSVNGNFTNIAAANGNITNLTAANGNITNLTSVNGNFTNIAAANGNITNLTAANGNITNLTSVNGNFTNIAAANGNITNLTSVNGNFTNIAAANGNITNLTSVNANFTNVTAVNGNFTNIAAANGNITNLTSVNGNFTNISAGNGTITNLNATNLTVNGNTNLTGNITVNGNLSVSDLNVTNFTAANGNITNLTSANSNITNLTAVLGNFTNITAANGNITNLTSANFSAANGNITNLTSANGNFTNLAAANGNITNLTSANSNITNLTAVLGNFTNITAANGNITNLTSANFSAANGNITNLTSANGNFTNFSAANGNITNLTSANSNITNLTAVLGNFTNITAANGNITNLTSANFTADNANITNLTTTNLNLTNLTAANGNITNLTSGNFSAANGNITNLTATNINATTIAASDGNFTNLTAANGNITNLTSARGNITNLTANTLNVTGQSIFSGINNTGPINNFGNLTSTGNTTLGGAGSTTNITGVTNVNGVLNVTNATVIGLNIPPNSINLSRISGDQGPLFGSNGVTGTASLLDTNPGTGAVTTYKATDIQTVAANTTIGNRLEGAKYQSLVSGNQLVDGSLFVNGDTILVGTNSATSTVIGKRSSSRLAGATTGIIGQTGITTNTPVTDVVTGTTATESVASTTLTNGLGKTNGLQVFEDRTRLTGGGGTAGAPSSSITLNSNGTTILGGAPGTLASNGSTGITATNPGASTGSGGIEVLSAPATVAPGTTIGDRLNGVTYQDKVSGNTMIDGDLSVNGNTNFVGKTGATSTVVGDFGTSKFNNATQGVSGQTGVVVRGAPVADPVTGVVSPAPESVASTTLTNGLGQTNGLKVFEDRTTLSGGGQQPSTLTMNDTGATFATSSGAPAKVTGVADGTSKFDAVNFGQLQALSNNVDGIANKAFSGIAQSAAMNSIPTSMAGHHYGIGIGSGFYAGQQAIAFGGSADIGEHIKVKAGVANGFGSSSSMTANAGAGFSW